MCSRWSIGCDDPAAPVRPEESVEHHQHLDALPRHDRRQRLGDDILAASRRTTRHPDQVNMKLLMNRADGLTLDLKQGTWRC